ncbi:hypothetical protein FOA52_014684 [Chlamydomonas sp. UWO 241]|nr:hypothetical protein FOA52_014684 [Chlamydomonas sp. UWO 241]
MTTRRARASFAGLFMMLMLCVAFLLVPIMADCRGDATGCTADCGCALDSYPIDHSRPNCVFHSYNYCCESEGCAQYCRCTDDCNIICGQPVG